MSLRRLLMPWVADAIVSERRQARRRRAAERRRRRDGAPHHVRFFLQLDDPSSVLLAQALPVFADRFDVWVEVVPVPPPPDWAAPERERLAAWARADTAALAAHHGLWFPAGSPAPTASAVATATSILVHAAVTGTAFGIMEPLTRALWSGDDAGLEDLAARVGSADAETVRERLRAGDAAREDLGHYLGGMLHYAGEWYWGIDRLHYLEARLRDLGAAVTADAASPLFAPAEPTLEGPALPPDRRAVVPPLEFFLSFRSPYSYLAVERTVALARHYGVDLKLRFVLPMVMRGLPVPARKSRYIVLDCKREAMRLGLPFGRICDPVGTPVERGLSLIPHAVAQGRGPDYVAAVLAGVFARGIDIGSDRGLRRLVEEAGLSWEESSPHLTRQDWRAEAEMNRADMLAAGLWGVPSFRFGDKVAWGQDRLWLVESWIRDHLAAAPADRDRETTP